MVISLKKTDPEYLKSPNMKIVEPDGLFDRKYCLGNLEFDTETYNPIYIHEESSNKVFLTDVLPELKRFDIDWVKIYKLLKDSPDKTIELEFSTDDEVYCIRIALSLNISNDRRALYALSDLSVMSRKANRSERLLQACGDHLFEYNTATGEMTSNMRLGEILDHRDYKDNDISSLLSFLHNQSDYELVKNFLVNGTNQNTELQFAMRARNGLMIPFSGITKNIKSDKNGNPLIVVGKIWKAQKSSLSSCGELRSADFYRKLFESAPFGVCEIDENSFCFFANAQTSIMTGYSQDELSGFGWKRLYDEVTLRKVHDRIIRAQAKNEDHVVIDLDAITKQGENAVFRVEYSTKTIEGRTMLVMCDVSELHHSQTRLLQQKNELEKSLALTEKAKQARTEFFAKVSHELRTPLSAMIGLSTLLAETDLEDSQKQYVNTIIRCGEFLRLLLEDVLLLAKVNTSDDEDQFHIELAPYDLQESVKEIFEMYRSMMADTKNIELEMNVETSGPSNSFNIISDESRIRQIIVNLVSNAIKYTKNGKVAVQVSIIMPDPAKLDDTSDPDLRICEICVSDTGPGIPDNEIDNIFEPFHQVNQKYQNEGVGLGLSIAKKFVHALGGDIVVKSGLGKGTSFFISIPVKQCNDDTMQMAKSPDKDFEKSSLKCVRALVVEDNPLNAIICERLLKKLNVSSKIVDCAENALEIMKLEAFDLVLMDISLPGMNGVDATRLIKQDPQYHSQSAYIVALTANAMDGDREYYLNSGMNDYIAKPFRLSDLERVISCCQKR